MRRQFAIGGGVVAYTGVGLGQDVDDAAIAHREAVLGQRDAVGFDRDQPAGMDEKVDGGAQNRVSTGTGEGDDGEV